MEAPDPLDKLRTDAVAAFEPHIEKEAQALVAVLGESLLYARPDHSRREIVIDRRAIIFAMLLVGTHHNYSEYASTASWFADWLRSRLPGRPVDPLVSKAVQPTSVLTDLAAKGYQAVASRSIRDILPTAADYAKRTMKRPRAGLRHLFVAMLTDPHHVLGIEELNWSLGRADRDDLCNTLLRHIAAEPEGEEDVEAWRPIFEKAQPLPPAGVRTGSGKPTGEGAGTPPPPPRPANPAFFVTPFDADRTPDQDEEWPGEESGPESDPLETNADVLAMARLICHEGADPPISIGIFGDWGSGKTTFMEALQKRVKKLARSAAAEEGQAVGPRFVSPIVQIRFNAWQFADADLWASLTAEFFDQLRAGGFEGGGKKIHAQLVEKVNEHVRGLSQEAGERRTAVAAADTKLREAQAEHDRAMREQTRGIRQALVTELAVAYEKNRSELARYGLVDPGSPEKLDQFIAIARDARTQAGQLKHIVTVLLAQWPLLLGILAVAGLVALGAATLAPDKPVAVTLAGLLTTAAGLIPLARRGMAVIHTIVREVGPFADRIGQAQEQGLKQVLAAEMELRAAAAESEALRATSERADRALARYVDPTASSNPPRVLRYLLEDDPDTKAFDKEIGLIGRARRLFQALDQIVAENRRRQEAARLAASNPVAPAPGQAPSPPAEPPDPEIPARIILYIDDLDRCTHEQVYKVLQAIHLLLAFKLFVVVVAVDMEWVEAAVAKSIEFASAESATEADKENDRRQRAVKYLSKIFQLPFWLKPFAGKDDPRYPNYIRSLTRAVEDGPAGGVDAGAEAEQAGRARTDPPRGSGSASEGKESGEIDPAAIPAKKELAADPAHANAGPAQDAAKQDPVVVAHELRTLQLNKLEEECLAGKAISALAAPDPRGVKRLVNVYKIVRSRLSETDDAMILGGVGRAPAYPLIALCAAVETCQPLDAANAFYRALRDGTKGSSLRGLGPTPEIEEAIDAMIAARGGVDAGIDEALGIARIVRRYSFNRFH